jgi:hypothetical protein
VCIYIYTHRHSKQLYANMHAYIQTHTHIRTVGPTHGVQSLLALRKSGSIGPIALNTRLHSEERGMGTCTLTIQAPAPGKKSKKGQGQMDRIEIVKSGPNRADLSESCAREALVKLRTLYGIVDFPLSRYVQRAGGEWAAQGNAERLQDDDEGGVGFMYAQSFD